MDNSIKQANELPVVVLSCKVFEHLFAKHLPEGLANNVRFLDYGLHQTPRKLKDALQDQIDAIHEPSLIVLGYGLCGNGLNGLKAGIHTLLAPRSDDCIGILLGSMERYRKEFFESPPTYYLSVGWLKSGSNPLAEFRNYIQRYGEQKAAHLMDVQYRHYKRLAFVAHNKEDLERCRPQALEVAAYCAQWGMVYEEIIGSEDYIRGLISAAQDLQLVDHQFILVAPGEQVKQHEYLHL